MVDFLAPHRLQQVDLKNTNINKLCLVSPRLMRGATKIDF